jgi:hypothetical protein
MSRPSKADLRERERRKADAEAHDRERAAIEAAIARGEFRLPAGAASPFTPAVDFIRARLAGVPIERFEEAMRSAMLALLRSDVPLDADVRRQIADMWERERRTKDEASIDKDRAFVDHVAMLKRNLLQRGMTAKQAEAEIAAKRFAWKRGTLDRKLRRVRKRLRKAAK